MAEKRALRADAERNREHILHVAQQVFATEGLAVPIDEVARRAGLGVGTLYRHFPTKEALFLAIVVDRMERLVAEARELATAVDAGEAFFGFLSRVVHASSGKKDFMDALSASGADVQSALGDLKRNYHAAVAVLLKRAQSELAVRADVDATEVYALLMGAVSSLERLGADSAPARARLLAVICDGLRTPVDARRAAVRPTPARGGARGASARKAAKSR